MVCGGPGEEGEVGLFRIGPFSVSASALKSQLWSACMDFSSDNSVEFLIFFCGF